MIFILYCLSQGAQKALLAVQSSHSILLRWEGNSVIVTFILQMKKKKLKDGMIDSVSLVSVEFLNKWLLFQKLRTDFIIVAP